MQYREFGNTGVNISVLGLGGMRLPKSELNGKLEFDYEMGAELVQRAYQLGINYFDTAPAYCNGHSEKIFAKGLKGIREKIILSTKYPVQNASYNDFMRSLENSLKNLDTDYIDFYHFWSLNLCSYQDKVMAKGGAYLAAQTALEQGLIRHISVSIHDDAQNVSKIVESGNFETVLLQYNLLNRVNEQAISKARAKGIGTVVMGPIAGGRLGDTSKQLAEMLSGNVKSSPELALRFVLTNKDVCCALSGMSSLVQLEENCAVASNTLELSSTELTRIEEAVEQNKELCNLYCTGCGYCLPCPAKVNIPLCFEYMNLHKVFGVTRFAKQEYAAINTSPWIDGNDASYCVDCGECEKKCPQNIEIRKQLKETHKTLSK